jgi:hypothetical protein
VFAALHGILILAAAILVRTAYLDFGEGRSTIRGAHITRSFGGRSSYSVGVPGTGLWYDGYGGRARESADRTLSERFEEALRFATAPEGSKEAKEGNFDV